MLAYDGTVSYYLDKNDYTKKTNGTASDVANTSFNGNAMMEWGQNGKKIYWKIVPDGDGKGFTFCVADHEADANYHCWNHYDCDNTIKDHFYTPCYFGSLVDTKLRSLSGRSNYSETQRNRDFEYAKANNPDSKEHWNIETYSDRLLLMMLSTLISKSTNSQSKFGEGYTNTNNTNQINTGTMNDRGLFWGATNGTTGVKVWGMENVWGNCRRLTAGCVYVSSNIKIKLTHSTADGSTVSGYNLDGTGYISMGSLASSSGVISHMHISTMGIVPATLSGSTSTYYTDRVNVASRGTLAACGGLRDTGKQAGIFEFEFVPSNESFSNTYDGSALSYK